MSVYANLWTNPWSSNLNDNDKYKRSDEGQSTHFTKHVFSYPKDVDLAGWKSHILTHKGGATNLKVGKHCIEQKLAKH